MAIYLPGPPIVFPPLPPPPPPPTATLKSASTKSAAITASKLEVHLYQVLFLVNPNDSEVVFSITSAKTISLVKGELKAEEETLIVVPPNSTYNLVFVVKSKVSPKILTITDNARRKKTYWSLLDVKFEKPKIVKKATKA